MQPRILVAGLCTLLALASSVHAGNGWVLWERPMNPTTGQPQGEWQSRQVFDAERWCRGEMTRAINRTLAAGWKGGRWYPPAKVAEFQCLPEGEDPRRGS